jgi:Ca2+-binding EF-hand superfamily protein
MKGLQGERLRQAFKYLDENQDGFIGPDQFKRIILVSEHLVLRGMANVKNSVCRN